jgi:hypothetical protein
MIADIRGGLGTQLLELLGCFAVAQDRGEWINEIRINCGGISDDGNGNCLKDYISDLFERLPVPCKVTDGMRKFAVFKEAGALDSILKNRLAVLRSLGPLMEVEAPGLPVLHVRRGDYEWVPLETYIDYASRHEVALIGNIADDTALVPGTNIAGSPVSDWLHAYYAAEVIGTCSTFLVSMLFMNPHKRMAFFSDQEGSVFADIVKPALDRLAHHFPNVTWL